MDLPGRTDELVKAVLEVQPNAVIVVQSGTPVTMPWADNAKALLQAWYGGNEGGNGIADVLFGDVNPVSSPLLYTLFFLDRSTPTDTCTVRKAPPNLPPPYLAQPRISKLPLRTRPSAIQRGRLRRI
jgi:hypothetical protein